MREGGAGYVWSGGWGTVFTVVYMRRGWESKEGEGCAPARGLLGDSVVYQAPLRQGVGGGVWRGKVGYRHQKHMRMTSPAP